MRTYLLSAVGISFGIAATSASGAVIANFQDDFTYPAPSNGWSYLWNAGGPVGSTGNYAPLVADSSSIQRYETQDQTPDAYPDAAPGSFTSVTQTTLVPGQGTAQNAVERYVLAAYTVSAADVAAAGGNQLVLTDYSFAVSATSLDGVTAKVYKNDTLLIDRPLPPGLIFSDDLPDGGPIPLGPFSAGDILYIAIGSNGVAPEQLGGTDTGDALVMDVEISLVPEPTSAAVLGMGALGMLLRRRR